MTAPRTEALAESDTLTALLDRLTGAHEVSDGQWEACCPAHEDRRASLSVTRGADGRALVHCHAGCATEAIVSAVGLRMRDLMPPREERNGHAGNGKSRIVAQYDYRDERGELLYQVVRFEPKDFRQRRPDGAGGWEWKVKGVRQAPYRLPGLLAKPDATVLVVEGERDADSLTALGLVSTCNSGGAGKWRDALSPHFAGRNVVVVPDNDDPGRDHAQQVARSLHGMAASVRILELPGLPPKGDVSDWLDAGNTAEELRELAKACPPWDPSAEHDSEKRARAPITASGPEKRPRTDLGLAERLVDRFGDRIRYVATWGRWHTWAEDRWGHDDTGAVHRFAQQTARAVLDEAQQAGDPDDREALAKFAIASEKRDRLNAAVALAATQQGVAIRHDQLDADPWLLNCRNCTVDLHTGEARPHDPADLITMTTGVEFPTEPGDDSPLWTEFLATIFDGDTELVGFIQRLTGAALVGQQLEHLLPIFWGGGANGKSVFTTTCLAALGDYGMQAPPGLLMAKRTESHPTELADLFGRRLVIIAETRDGQKLDEGLVKSVSGGDAIRARRMRENFWQFTPSHLPIVVTNHRPIVRGNDHGIWRRLRLIPFNVTIPEERQDSRLPEKLRAELPSILRWMVDGCLAWQHGGLCEPQSVLAATGAYRDESDVVRLWIAERCNLASYESARASALYHDFRKWCEGAGEHELSQRRFSERLAALGYEKTRDSSSVRYLKIGLADPT